MNLYDIGDMARISGAFTTAANAPIDPTAITLKIQRIGSAVTTMTFDNIAGIIKDAIGVYHFDYLITSSGKYRYEWTGTGAAAASEPGGFIVRVNEITGL